MDKYLTVLLSDEDGYAQFLIDIINETEAVINFKIYEVDSWEDETYTPLNIELYVTGMIKWDGCAHLRFGEERNDGTYEGYIHLCGRHGVEKHIKMLNALYALAAKRIKGFQE